MPARQDDDLARRPAPAADGSFTRSVPLGAAVALAVVATLVVFLTADVRVLRLATVGAAWAVVAATFVAVRRGAQLQAAREREHELRRTHDRELDLQAAARRELELEVENELRRETEDGLRGEFAALRADLGALARLREDLGAADLGQLSELRAELAGLRTDLTEQLSSEMLVERIIMRTQGFRVPGEERPPSAAAARDVAPPWVEEPRELAAGRPSLRLDEPTGTREYEPVPAERMPSAPRTTSVDALVRPAPGTGEPALRTPLEWPAERSLLDVPEPAAGRAQHGARYEAQHAVRHEPHHREEPRREEPEGSPREWFAARSPADPPRPVPYRRRHTDEEAGGPPTDLTAALTQERPGARRPDGRSERPPLPPVRPLGAHEDGPGPAPEPASYAGHVRVEEILAESGGTPPSGGRRRRRYRDDDAADDVLSRVLRGE